MIEKSPLDRLRKACIKRCEEIEDSETTQMIAGAIGDRRLEDFVDIIARTETKYGWNTTVNYLVKASDYQYPAPLGSGIFRTDVEPLKYREMIFALLSCTGYEPIPETTSSILQKLAREESSVQASHALAAIAEEQTEMQIANGDTSFFNLTRIESTFPDDLKTKIELKQDAEIRNLCLVRDGDSVNIKPLWYTEVGRQALSSLGIQGTTITLQHFDIVLSVLQVSPDTKTVLSQSMRSTDEETPELIPPSNTDYRNLLDYSIEQDIDGLRSCASRYSVNLLNTLLTKSLVVYNQRLSSDSYRGFLQSIGTYVTVRTIDSIISLQRLTINNNPRIATPAAVALGNFYHASSVSTLVELICRTKNKEVQNAAINATRNLSTKYHEVNVIIRNALNSDCKNLGTLMKLFRIIN
ncbi:MAG: hypothetical protein ACTSUO_01320 [Candidatus Thorarchaeota archaeon]